MLVAGLTDEAVATLEGNNVSGRPAVVLVGTTVLLVTLAVAGNPDAVIKVELLVGWPIVDMYVVVTVTTEDGPALELLLEDEDKDDG